MNPVGGALIVLQGHNVLGENHPLPLQMGGQRGIAEDVILVNAIFVVIHGAIPDAVGDVVAQGVHPPGLAPGKGRVVIGEEDAAPKAEMLVEQCQHFFGKIVAVPGQIQGKCHCCVVPGFWNSADGRYLLSAPEGSGSCREMTDLLHHFLGIISVLATLYTFYTINSIPSPQKASEKFVTFL